MTSTFYFLVLGASFVALIAYLVLSVRTNSVDSWLFISTVVMMCILSVEFYREAVISMTGQAPTLTHARAAFLRLEHTYLGFFMGEVMHRVQTIVRKTHAEND